MLGMNLVYMLLAILGLGFLIFIHELGHYWMARRVGMRVDTFAIGFGKPIYSWEKDGVKWQIGWLPFGGYVKIAGMDSDAGKDAYEIPDGFYGKGPWNRIKVAFMGPAVNLLFAFFLFALLWALGGREKPFSEVTSKIGWVDPHSELFAKGVRPGDEVVAYDGKDFQGLKDHLYATMVGGREVLLKGNRQDYVTKEKAPFEYPLKAYTPANAIDGSRKTLGIIVPANYLIYSPPSNPSVNVENFPLARSGIVAGDRVIWVDGELIFSTMQLENLLNDGRALLTIKRKGTTLLARVPRVAAEELKFTQEFKDELEDWQFESDLKGEKLQHLYVIPYNLTNDCVVEGELHFIDSDKEQEAFVRRPFSSLEAALQPEDIITAVDGHPVDKAYQLLRLLQERSVNIIVQRDTAAIEKVPSDRVDDNFDQHLDLKQIEAIATTIGSETKISQIGPYWLLHPVVPKKEKDLVLGDEAEQLAMAHEKLLQSIEDKEKRRLVENLIEQKRNKLMIGISPVDRKVEYNPSPIQMFNNVFDEIVYTLSALFSGSLSPKFLSGPVGIIQVVQNTWLVGAKEALFWIGAISLNLGILNLLPIPVLDGGTIAFSLVEMVTRRRLHPKTLEKIILPFVVLLIGFFIFVTYHDLLRIFTGFWR